MSVVTRINRMAPPRRLDNSSHSAVSLGEVISIIAELRGITPDLRLAPWRPGDRPWYVSVIRAIRAGLDWSPRVAFRDGLRELDRWLDARFALSATPPAELQEAHA
jgi:CDP-paratose 2-epimerase